MCAHLRVGVSRRARGGGGALVSRKNHSFSTVLASSVSSQLTQREKSREAAICGDRGSCTRLEFLGKPYRSGVSRTFWMDV